MVLTVAVPNETPDGMPVGAMSPPWEMSAVPKAAVLAIPVQVIVWLVSTVADPKTAVLGIPLGLMVKVVVTVAFPNASVLAMEVGAITVSPAPSRVIGGSGSWAVNVGAHWSLPTDCHLPLR